MAWRSIGRRWTRSGGRASPPLSWPAPGGATRVLQASDRIRTRPGRHGRRLAAGAGQAAPGVPGGGAGDRPKAADRGGEPGQGGLAGASQELPPAVLAGRRGKAEGLPAGRRRAVAFWCIGCCRDLGWRRFGGRQPGWTNPGRHRATSCKRWWATGGACTVSASTTSGGCASCGGTAMRLQSKSWSTMEGEDGRPLLLQGAERFSPESHQRPWWEDTRKLDRL